MKFKYMWSRWKVFVLHLSAVLDFLVILWFNFMTERRRVPLCILPCVCWTSLQCLHALTWQDQQGLWPLAAPPHPGPAGMCSGAVPGREGSGRQEPMALHHLHPAWPAHFGLRHISKYRVGFEGCNFSLWGWGCSDLDWVSTCKWLFFIRVGPVRSQCLWS